VFDIKLKKKLVNRETWTQFTSLKKRYYEGLYKYKYLEMKMNEVGRHDLRSQGSVYWDVTQFGL
jgi:hypothetical protein